MSLVLDLSPSQEQQIAEYAEREGLSVIDYILRRVLPPVTPIPTTLPKVSLERRAKLEKDAADAFATSGMTEDELEEYVMQTIKQARIEQRESGTP